MNWAPPANRLRHSINTGALSFVVTWSAMLCTPISQTQPGRSSFMRIKLGGILRCATVSTFQTTPIVSYKQKCGLDLSLLLSASDVCFAIQATTVLVRLQAWRSVSSRLRAMAPSCERQQRSFLTQNGGYNMEGTDVWSVCEVKRNV